MKPYVSLVTLGVADLKRSTTFYRDGLGLPTFGDHEGVTFLKMRGAWLSLYPLEDLAADADVPSTRSGFSGFTLAHNVDSREEVDVVIKQAEKAGAVVTQAARETEWGGYAGYFSDPDGFLWEIAWNPHMDLTHPTEP